MLKKPLAYPSHLLYNTAPMEQYFRQSRPEITDRQSAAQTAKRWGMTKRRVLQLCREKKVYAAKLVDGVWTIPTVAVRPPDGRQHRGAHIPKHLANHLRYADAAVRDAREAGLGNPDDALEYFVRGSASHLHTLKYSSFNFGEVCEILSGRAVEGKPKCNRKDVEYHQLAINFIMAALKERRWLSVRFVEQLHGLLLCGDPNYREPMKGRKCVKKCVERVRSLKKHPVWLAADFFVRFLALKPYSKQLERTAYMVVNFILMRNGYPPVIIYRGMIRWWRLRVLEQPDEDYSKNEDAWCTDEETLRGGYLKPYELDEYNMPDEADLLSFVHTKWDPTIIVSVLVKSIKRSCRLGLLPLAVPRTRRSRANPD